jgi:ATP-dependent protease HslVU (ClpYQ) peptidase subunit
MTCIVGIQQDGVVWLGGDSAAAAGTAITPYGLPKVFARDGYLLGFAGSFRAGQVLQHHVKLPPLPKATGTRLDAYVVREVVPAIRDSYIEHAIGEPGPTQLPGWPVMLGVSGVLYSMDFDWAVHRSRNGYMAIGSGDDFALGAMHATRREGWHPGARIRRALEAAAHHSMSVCGPFRIISA